MSAANGPKRKMNATDRARVVSCTFATGFCSIVFSLDSGHRLTVDAFYVPDFGVEELELWVGSGGWEASRVFQFLNPLSLRSYWNRFAEFKSPCFPSLSSSFHLHCGRPSDLWTIKRSNHQRSPATLASNVESRSPRTPYSSERRRSTLFTTKSHECRVFQAPHPHLRTTCVF
jgi:hypothetical protein